MVSKIISGGQTGADLGGLKAALILGIKTGGRAPKGFKTELGQNLELKSIFGLTEDASDDYAKRTLANISLSDATLIFASNSKSPGTKLTIKNCEIQKKPYLLVDPSLVNAVDLTFKFLQNQVLKFSRKITLNVAGNRESKAPGIQEKVISILTSALQ